MKKLLFAFIASVLLLLSCGSKDSFRIKGTAEGLEDGTMMTLSTLDLDGLNELDSVVLKNGKFTFKGEIESPSIAVITFEVEDNISGCELFVESGNIEVSVSAISGEQHVAGTPNNDAFQKFYDDTQVLNDEADELEDKIKATIATQGDCTDLYRQMGDLQDRFKALLAKSITDNADKLYAYRQLIDNYSLFEPDETKAMIDKLEPAFGQDIVFIQLSAMIDAQLSTSLGHPYIEFEAPLLDKKYGFSTKASLSQYVQKNKIVLLDFWASWCTPCMNELPNLKSAYRKFKSKGFEIVSVSVDEESEDWIKAVTDNGMDWVQLWNGEDDIENSAAVKYSISAIPATFLIDSDGTIIGRNLRDNELEDALEDYFSKN